MAVEITVLGSGSQGNCTVLSGGSTRILVDAGFSCKETIRRLRSVAIDPESINGVIISHEHSDHIAGLFQLARKLKVTVYMTAATHSAWRRWQRDKMPPNAELPPKIERLETFHPGQTFTIGDIDVTAFTIPHDAAEPCGFTFRTEGVKIGYATDLGYVPQNIKHHLKRCDGLVIESNHDLEMLRGGPYPWMVKQRVLSRLGHLSNDALAEFLTNDYDGGAAFLVLAHLSEQNNHPEIAKGAAERALALHSSLFRNQLLLAQQHAPLAPITL
jgi:phosphoribosyl 1,2-cyclic phosphodiesterase